MPYDRLADLPDETKALPRHAQEIWRAAFNSAWEQYEDEEKAFATAWAAVKQRYRKEGGRWVAKGGEHMDGKWIAVFRTGTHTDSAGNKREWTKDDLDHMVASYDPAEHEAPAVIGHPQTNAPAYGWVEGLKRQGELLYARFKQLVPEFVDMVRKGTFKKRSIALYPDGTLRHIGFLGGTPPAVKGLPDVGFKEGEVAETFEYDPFPEDADFASREEDKKAQQARAKRYGIAVKEGGNVTKPSEWAGVPDDGFLDPVNYRYPCPDADQTRAAASYWGKPKNQEQYSSQERAIITRRLDAKKKKFKIGESTPKKGEHIMSMKQKISSIFSKGLENLPDDDPLLQPDEPRTFTEAELKAKADEAAEKARKEEKERVEKEYAEKEKKARLDAKAGEVKTFVEGLKKDGHVIPAWDKMGLSKFMESLDDEEGHEFAEGSEKVSQLAFMKKFLEELPKVVTFKEVADRGSDTGDTGNAGQKIEALVRKKMGEDKDLTYGQAFAEVQKENTELAQEYAREIKGQA